MLLAFALIDPVYEQPLFHTTGGLVALGIGAMMVVLGSLVMKRIVEIKV
jgi:Flp pilus assembly protein TadB